MSKKTKKSTKKIPNAKGCKKHGIKGHIVGNHYPCGMGR